MGFLILVISLMLFLVLPISIVLIPHENKSLLIILTNVIGILTILIGYIVTSKFNVTLDAYRLYCKKNQLSKLR